MRRHFISDSIESVRKWHALAERRRRHFVELYRSERWRRYYTEEAFLAQMREVDRRTSRSGSKILERIARVAARPPAADGVPAD